MISVKSGQGAIVQVSTTKLPQYISFQYNPDQLTRELSNNSASGSRADVNSGLGVSTAPNGSIKVTIKLSALDDIAKGDSTAIKYGIYPQLSALELLVYPSSIYIAATAAAQKLGVTEVIPPSQEITLFVWGGEKQVPVIIKSLSITEQLHDKALNPVFAEIVLTMETVKYTDVSILNPAFHMVLANQIKMETLSQL